MGCDIHMIAEQKVGDKWVCLNQKREEWELDVVSDSEVYDGRDYTLFALLADVRSEEPGSNIFQIRWFPDDASEECRQVYDAWINDAHSPSFIYLSELYNPPEETVLVRGMKEEGELREFLDSLESNEPDFTLLYPYCRWTSQSGYTPFECRLPVRYFLSELIESVEKFLAKYNISPAPHVEFDGTGGSKVIEGRLSDIRLVFWFDN